jgi:hypothetical protein
MRLRVECFQRKTALFSNAGFPDAARSHPMRDFAIV